MNKKVLALGMSAAMVAALGLAACGSNQASESSSAASSSASSAATQTQTQSSTTAKPSASASSADQSNSAQSTSSDAAQASGTLSYKGTSEDGKYKVTFIDEMSTASEVGTIVVTDTATGEEKEYSGDLTWTMGDTTSHGKIMCANGDTIEFDTVADEDMNIAFVFDEYGKVKMEMDNVTVPTQSDGVQSSTSQSDTSQPASNK